MHFFYDNLKRYKIQAAQVSNAQRTETLVALETHRTDTRHMTKSRQGTRGGFKYTVTIR